MAWNESDKRRAFGLLFGSVCFPAELMQNMRQEAVQRSFFFRIASGQGRAQVTKRLLEIAGLGQGFA